MKTGLLLLLFLYSLSTMAEGVKKQMRAIRLEKPLKIDGNLNEEAYDVALPASNFVQILPHNGEPAMQRTEVFFFYDNSAIYVGACLYDEEPDSIFRYFSQRDAFNKSDYFGVYLDPQNTGQNAFGFFLSAAGSQMDIMASRGEYDSEDTSWDAVWESKVIITEKGWQVEMKIPYSALRFPSRDVQLWGMNMFRNISRYQSNNSWSFLDVKEHGFLHKAGELSGIENITPPLRLSITPYLANYIEFKGGNQPQNFIKGGLDLKLGINESFTLDMMLVPDFGQVQSDDQELNLSPYELYYDERRSFFTEGTELFSRANIFYSRRIGSNPKFGDQADSILKKHEKVNFRTTEVQMVNATKFSGRTNNGIGIGLLNAITLPSYAEIKDTLTGQHRNYLVQPLSNYNVAVIEKTLPNNSYLTFINTNLSMWDNAYSANVTGTEFRVGSKKNTYALTGSGAMSFKPLSDNTTGYKYKLKFAKTKGSFRFDIERALVSKYFDPQDLGYLRRPNEIENELTLNYGIYEPFGNFRTWDVMVSTEYVQLQDPNVYFSSETELFTEAFFKNYHRMGLGVGYVPELHDYFETRTNDERYFKKDEHLWMHTYYGTNNRKKLSAFAEFSTWAYLDGRFGMEAELEINAKIGNKFSVEYDLEFEDERDDIGFVSINDDQSDVYFGSRNVRTIENQINAQYAFNNRLSVRLRARHYWSGANYSRFYLLQENGLLSNELTYAENADLNFNAFSVDANLRWEFAPGSELSIAWKNQIQQECELVEKKYLNNLSDIFGREQINSLSIKVLYYLDYNSLRRKTQL